MAAGVCALTSFAAAAVYPTIGLRGAQVRAENAAGERTRRLWWYPRKAAKEEMVFLPAAGLRIVYIC
jgi:hypothetical protein